MKFSHFATIASAWALTICHSWAGTFEVIESQCSITGTPQNFDDDSTIASSIDPFVSQGYIAGYAIITSGTRIAVYQAGFEFKWKVRYVPAFQGDIPSNKPYKCLVQARNKSKAVVDLFCDNADSESWARCTVNRGYLTPMTRFAQLLADQHAPGNNPVDGAIEENGDVGVPWDLEGAVYEPKFTFTFGPEGWVGWVTVIDLTPSIDLDLAAESPVLTEIAEGAGFLKKQMHLIAVGGVQVDTPWT